VAQSYRAVYPGFWTGETGRQIRRAGVEAQLLALYVLTSPHSNMIGLYHLPLAYAAADTGMSEQSIRKGLDALAAADFISYDFDAECVWIHEAVVYQAANGSAKTKDHRLTGAVAQWKTAGSRELKAEFRRRYESILPFPEGPCEAKQESAEAPSKPLGSPLEGASVLDTDRDRDRDRDTDTADAESVWSIWREEVERQLCDVLPLVARETEKINVVRVSEKRRSNAWVRRVFIAFLTSTNRDVDAKPRTLGYCLHWWSKIEHALVEKGYRPDEVAA
jgi:hypothetical protein